MKFISSFAVRHCRFIILFFIVFTVLFLYPLKDIKTDPDVQNMLPPDMESFRTLKETELLFGGMEMALVIIEADDVLKRDVRKQIRDISENIKNIESVDQVNAMPEAEHDPFSEKTDEELKESLRVRIKHNPMVYGSLVSKNFNYASIVIHLSNTGNELAISSEIKNAAESVEGPGKLHFGGMPFLRERISKDIPEDMSFFIFAGLLVMLIFLYIFFRQWRGVFLPLSVVLMSIIFSMGLVPLLGWKMMTVTAILPVMLIAVANNYGVHLVSRYQQENTLAPNSGSPELVKRTVAGLGWPVIATGLTTVAGFLCLNMHMIVPASQMGILAGAGIMFALVASLFFIPAVLSLLSPDKPVIVKNTAKKYILEKYLYRIGWVISRYPKRVLSLSFVMVILSAFGIFFINVESNLVKYYPDDHPIVETSDIIDAQLGGAQTISITVDGDVRSPEILREIDTFEKEISEMEHIGNTNSVAGLVKLMTRGVKNEDEEGYNEIPESEEVVQWYFDRYKERVSEKQLKTLITPDYSHARIIAQINSPSSRTIQKVVKRVKILSEKYPHMKTVTGSGEVFSNLISEVVSGQLLSLFMSVFVVALLMVLFFRSFTAGLFGFIPLFISLVLLFGIMGYTNVNLDIATAMLSSVIIGVGADYTIHFLWHYRDLIRKGFSEKRAVRHTVRTAGRGIVFNGASVMIGFSVLMFSSFLPIKFFGFLIILSIGSCMIAALALLPAVCAIYRPKFLYK